MKKDFIIDADKWICGKPHPRKPLKKNSLGEGMTQLLNGEGYMCCLGQCLSQVESDLDILYISTPQGIADKIKTKNVFLRRILIDDNLYSNSGLSVEAMEINDDEEISLKTRVNELRNLFTKYDCTIKFKNIKKYLK